MAHNRVMKTNSTLPEHGPEADTLRDYDPAVAEKIENLLEEARKNPARQQAVYKELDVLIFGLTDAQD
jgi:hypothetical protein